MQDNIIEITHLSKEFPSSQEGRSPLYALKDLQLMIPRGSVYGIIGMSGAGKSTLLRCLTGLEIPTQGSITFDGKQFPHANGRELELLRKQMGMVFQHFQLFSSRTVGSNIGYPLEITGTPAIERDKRIRELLSIVGLESKKDHYPSQLSGGEKQRVGIARALATNPRLLLCDEPTSALDPKTTRDILQLLTSLNQRLGITIVIITHQLETVKQACHRVAVLAQGQIVEEGHVADIFTNPRHPVTQRLLHLDPEQVPSELLKERDAGKCIVRLGFEGRQAKEPVISHMIKRYDIEVNILSGGLDYLQETVVGHLFIELTGLPDDIQKALTFLRTQHVVCEVLK
ncbi:MAG: methionine ABC transporter ATP-binding protein [Parachlamydiaceae bacterium]